MCKNAFKGRQNTERTLAVPTVKLHVLYLHLWTVSIVPCQFIINICCSQRTQCQMQTAKVHFNCGTTSTENYFPVRGRKFQNMLYRMIHLEVMHGIIYLGFFPVVIWKVGVWSQLVRRLQPLTLVSTVTSVTCLWIFIFTWHLKSDRLFCLCLTRRKDFNSIWPIWLFMKDFVRITCKAL